MVIRARLALGYFITALGCAAPLLQPEAAEPASPWGVLRRTTDGDTLEVELRSEVVPNPAGARPETDWIAQKTERIWVARKRVVKAGAPARVQWAESTSCFQLIETLARLTDVDASTETGPPVRWMRILDKGPSGQIYTLEGRAFAPSQERSTDVKLIDGASAPVGHVIETALRDLAPCWSDEAPSVQTPS